MPYEPHTINILKDEQFTPEFLAINPNGKIPAMVDPNGPGWPMHVWHRGTAMCATEAARMSLIAVGAPVAIQPACVLCIAL